MCICGRREHLCWLKDSNALPSKNSCCMSGSGSVHRQSFVQNAMVAIRGAPVLHVDIKLYIIRTLCI